MLFKPVYDKKFLKYINWKNLSYNKSFDLIIHIIVYLLDIDYYTLEKYFKELDWNQLCSNSGAIEYIKRYYYKINWNYLSENESDEALDMLLENKERINFSFLSSNSNNRAVQLLKLNIDKIDWDWIVSNKHPQAIEIIFNNLEKIIIKRLSWNDKALDILKEYPDEICWENIALECNDLDFLRKNIDKLENYWHMLSNNKYAFPLLIENPDKIDTVTLFNNENDKVINLIRKNLDNIYITEDNIEFLCYNKNGIDLLFPLKYQEMSKKMVDFKEELTSYVFNPERMKKFGDKYGIRLEELQDYY